MNQVFNCWEIIIYIKIINFIMMTEQKPIISPIKPINQLSSYHYQLKRNSFRLRDIKPANVTAVRFVSKSSPRQFNDLYHHQQQIMQRITSKDKPLCNTASNFFNNFNKTKLLSISPNDTSLRRTLYNKKSISNLSPQRPPSSVSPIFGRTSFNFRQQNIFKDQTNNNYLNKYKIIKQLGKGSFSTVYLAQKIDKKANPIKQPFSQRKIISIETNIEENVSLVEKCLQNSICVDQKKEFEINNVETSEKSQLNIESVEQNTLFAIKVYEKFKMTKDPHKFKNIRKEINVMENLNNNGIVRLFQSVQTLTKISLVVEFGGEQSLLQYVKANFPLSQSRIRDITSQIINALQYLHQRNIVHRDIKLQNILIHNNKVKLIDFGFSCLTHKNQKLSVVCGTPNYMAPQVISRKEYIGEQADIWSFGVVVYALAEGRHPFKADSYNQLQRLVNRGKLQFRRSKDPLFIQFLKRIMRVKGSERPSAREVQQMKWLKQEIISN